MMPVYTDPSQPCQMRPQGYYHQGFGNNSQHMTMDAPPSCHGSCVHGSFPAYNAYWPPFYPPQPQVPYHQCCMNHAGFHPPHASYAPPCYVHPPFPVGYQPWYDADKDVPGKHHCAKCSPQICNPKSGRGVVIEEHEPETEKGKQGEAVLPVRSTNCPYPIIWIPHENARNQEHGSSFGSGNHNQPSVEVKAPENMTIQKSFPQSWHGCFPFDESTMKSLVQNQDRKKAQTGKTVELPFDISKLKSLLQGQDMKEAQIQKNKEESGQLTYPTSWTPSRGKRDDVEASESSKEDRKTMQNGKTVEYPFDISKLKSLLQGQDVKEAQNQKNKEEPGQVPYPIFWIPSYEKREDVEASESKKSSNEGRNLESCSSDPHVNEGQKIQKEGKERNFECNVLSDADEKSSVRNIPVKNHLQEPRNIPVKLSENHLPKPTERTKRFAKNESVKDTTKEQSSSSSKASKLPPVCLRVDPLPKKRNGGSKSVNHPKQMEESKETKIASPLRSKKAESTTVSEACNVKCEEANEEKKMAEGSLNALGTEKESVESNSNLQEVSNCEIVKPCEAKDNRELPAKKTFTEEEAARIIQSMYRGYDVRRWEPIKKLKEIATIREQMGDVKRRIEALEVFNDQHIEEKEIIVNGEMVMNLLLKLDAVEGLHPSIRDFRKSLARELSDIQDKLDSLKNSCASAKKEAVKEQVEIKSQPSDSPVNLEHSQLAEENKMVSDSNLEKVLLLSPEEHPMSVLSRTDEKQAEPAAEAEKGSGLFETLATDSEQATENAAAASSTTIPEKIGEVETVVPCSSPSADGNGKTVTNVEENKALVESLEEPINGLPQVVEETETNSTREPENASEVFEAEANASENEDRKGEDDTVLHPEKDVELSELPVGVIDEETEPLSQDSSSSYICEGKMTAMDPKTVSHEEIEVDHSPDNSKGIGQETSEPQDEKEQSPETKVIVKEQPLEPEVILNEQPPEPEITEPEISKETKKLMEENQRFKETMETLVKAGREQLEVISKLTSRVKSLEKKLSHKKKTQIRRRASKPMSASPTDAVL
ncbi:unnamed protein product [Arabidopsis lyrata]|nr:unnamed protein product [Arabidopsis lyrata]